MKKNYQHMIIGNFGEILDDRDVKRFIKFFTELEVDEAEKLFNKRKEY